MIRIKNAGVLLCAFTLSSFYSTLAQAEDNRSWYIGGGIGITELDPDTGNTGYNVSDKSDTGFKLFGGYDFTERFSVEAFYADLGASKLDSNFVTLPDGEITYSTLGASALWYFWRNGESGGSDPRKGWQAYVHGGLSFLANSASSGIKFTQDNSTQIQYGAALEYGLNNGIALRAGLDLYDKDASMAFVGVLKRFGTATKRKAIAEPKPEPVIEVKPEVKPEVVVVAPVIVPEVDTDKDGIVDSLDGCSDSPKEFKVDKKGCSIIDLQFDGVNFENKSYDLTDESKKLLDEVVIMINLSPEFQKIEVSAHTDYKGDGKSNLELSEKRALSVKDYLVARGVNEKRLVSKGYGESQPIANNETAEGRAKNRRVELTVLKDEPVDVNQPGAE